MKGKPMIDKQKALYAGDGVAITATVGYFTDWLPAVATFLTIVWFLIRIWETDTVQGWVTRKKKVDGQTPK